MSDKEKEPTFNQDGVSGFDIFREMLYKSYIEAEIQLVREVIENYTEQKLIDEDWKKVVRAFCVNDYSKYRLLFDGVILGTITYINKADSIGFQFDPVK